MAIQGVKTVNKHGVTLMTLDHINIHHGCSKNTSHCHHHNKDRVKVNRHPNSNSNNSRHNRNHHLQSWKNCGRMFLRV